MSSTVPASLRPLPNLPSRLQNLPHNAYNTALALIANPRYGFVRELGDGSQGGGLCKQLSDLLLFSPFSFHSCPACFWENISLKIPFAHQEYDLGTYNHHWVI